MEANERLNELRRYLTNLGLTQDIIAKRFGVTKQAIYSLLTGRKPFGKQNAIKWANELGLNMIEPLKPLIDSGLAVFLLSVSNKTAPKGRKNAPILGRGRVKIKLLNSRCRSDRVQR